MASPPNITASQTVCEEAYHGTSLANAQKIIASGWNLSGGKQMLGDGVYFFEDSSSEAMNWAVEHHPGPWAVIQARVQHGRCLRLLEPSHQASFVKMASQLRYQGVNDPTDALVINALAKIANIDTVRAVRRKQSLRSVRTGYPLEQGFQLMLCVRTISNILSPQIVVTKEIK